MAFNHSATRRHGIPKQKRWRVTNWPAYEGSSPVWKPFSIATDMQVCHELLNLWLFISNITFRAGGHAFGG